MKRLILCISFALGLLSAGAQSADERIGALLNNADWFSLETEYPRLKDSVGTEVLKPMSEAMLGIYFNRTDDAIRAIDNLLANHQQEIGFTNTYNMVILKAMTEKRRGNVAAAIDIMNSFISQLKASKADVDLSAAENVYKMCDVWRGFDAPSLSRLGQNVEVEASLEPIRLNIDNDTAYRGNQLTLPVCINGKPFRVMLDTGSPTTFCSTEFARKAGLRTVADSILITGVGSGYGSTAIMDSMAIGTLVFRNLPVTVAGNDMSTDSILKLGAVIGMDVIDMCGEIQIFPKDGKIVFPAKPSPLPATGRNIYYNETGALRLQSLINGKRCVFMFDTGNALAVLSQAYYNKNKQETDSLGVRTTRKSGGYGSYRETEYLQLPELTLRVGDTDMRLAHVFVLPGEQNNTIPDDGNIGLSLIENCRKATLNLRDMFLDIEK